SVRNKCSVLADSAGIRWLQAPCLPPTDRGAFCVRIACGSTGGVEVYRNQDKNSGDMKDDPFKTEQCEHLTCGRFYDYNAQR
ncbi:hypothetical protein, partial [Spirosoma daeguense]